MANFEVAVEPAVLEWARESIGLPREQAAKKLGLSTLDLRYLEEGAASPTIGQLRKMVDVYKRPLAVFFLSKPAKDFDAMKDFRLLPGNDGKPFSRELTLAFRRVHMQRETAQELAELAEEIPPPLALSLNLDTDPELAGEAVRAWLGTPIRYENDIYLSHRDDLNQWIELVEAKAILVTQAGRVNLTEMRGCSVSDQPFPAIMLNGKDSPRGRVFTLMHELVHVLQRSGAVCDMDVLRPSSSTNAWHIGDRERIERFCNHVAAATLMPRNRVLSDQRVFRSSPSTRWTDDELKQLADMYGVSREAMLLRLVELGHASWDYYFDRRPYFLQMYEDSQEERQAGKGGPNYYRMKLRDFGRRYVRTVVDAYNSRDITGSDLSDYLDMKVNRLPGLEAELQKRR